MNIAHITESTSNSGGVEQAILLIKGLRKNGHNITLITQPESQISQRLANSGIKIRTLRMRQDYDILSALTLRNILKHENIDILHAHHPRAHAIGLMATLGLPNIKFVVTRRVIFNLRNNIFSRLKYKVKRIDKFVVVSKAIEKDFLDYGVSPKILEVIYNVTDTGRFNPGIRSDIRRELRISDTDFVVSLLGNYSFYKGHTFLLEAIPAVLKSFPSVKFIFAGKVPDKVTNLSGKLNVGNSVFFLGFRSDVPEILKASDLLVCPSTMEGLAGSLIEAMAMKLPTVATNVGGNSEIVKHNETGILIPPGNVKAISDAISYIIENPNIAKKMGEEGSRVVKKTFSVETMISKHEKLYAELLGEPC